jgi:hypothetical protein
MADQISLRVYRSLLKLYPRSFYVAFHEEMVAVFEEQYQAADGRAGVGRLWLRTLADFAVNVPLAYVDLAKELVMLRRAVDIVLGLVGVAIGLWFLLPVALLIKLDSRGPVFYVADRIGKDGKLFPLYKLRSMTEDRQITRVGCFLRRTYLDEWPQFYNLLNGSMTLFGPRPGKPGEDVISTRKPGIIGA